MRFTTILLIILIIVVTTLVSKGQINHNWGKPVTNEDLPINIGWVVPNVFYTKIDTIKTILIVTINIPECIGDCRITKCVDGYEIIKQNGYDFEWSYLDQYKKQFSKNVIVWMSKPIEK